MFVCCITCFLTANQVLYRFYWQVAGRLHKNMVLRLEVEASECDCSLAFILCSSIARFKFGFLCARMQLVSASSACIKRKNSTVINNAVCNALCLIYFVFFMVLSDEFVFDMNTAQIIAAAVLVACLL